MIDVYVLQTAFGSDKDKFIEFMEEAMLPHESDEANTKKERKDVDELNTPDDDMLDLMGRLNEVEEEDHNDNFWR